MLYDENIWDKIQNDNDGEFVYKLLSKDSIPLLNIGIQRNGNRFLLLELPLKFKKHFKNYDGKYFSLKYLSYENCILIILNDESFSNIFDDFIFSFYFRVRFIESPDEYSKILINHFNKWNSIFK
jgi:hypothetical protein